MYLLSLSELILNLRRSFDFTDYAFLGPPAWPRETHFHPHAAPRPQASERGSEEVRASRESQEGQEA